MRGTSNLDACLCGSVRASAGQQATAEADTEVFLLLKRKARSMRGLFASASATSARSLTVVTFYHGPNSWPLKDHGIIHKGSLRRPLGFGSAWFCQSLSPWVSGREGPWGLLVLAHAARGDSHLSSLKKTRRLVLSAPSSMSARRLPGHVRAK